MTQSWETARAKTGPVKQVHVQLQPIDCEKVQSIQLLHQTLCWASFSLAPMASERFGEQIGGGKWEKSKRMRNCIGKGEKSKCGCYLSATGVTEPISPHKFAVLK